MNIVTEGKQTKKRTIPGFGLTMGFTLLYLIHHRFDPVIDGFSKHIFNGVPGFLGDHN